MRVEPEHRRDEIPSEPPGPVAMQEGTDRLAGEAPDDEAALADVDAGEFPPEPGGERASRPEPGTETGHATEDPWLRSENSPADEVSVGEPAGDEPAVGVASVPSPGEVTSPQDEREAEPGPAAEAPAGAPAFGFPSGDGAAARDEAAIRDTAAAREAAAERDETAKRDETGEPDRPSDTDLMTEAATGTGQEVGDTGRAADEAARGADETGPAEEAAAGPDELAPGEVPVAAGAALWEAETIDEYRDRWQQLQLRFVDDPRQATEQAQALVGDVCQGLTDALDRHRSDLDRWRGAQLDDTEELRMAVRRYRDLLDRILGL